jgi:hypothetical protein
VQLVNVASSRLDSVPRNIHPTLHIEHSLVNLQTAPSTMDASDEVWARRHTKRWNAVHHVLKSDDYKECVRMGYVIAAPDPEDRRVSKRAWERSVQDWRKALKALAQPT